MKSRFGNLLLVFAVTVSLAWGQAAKAHKAAVPVDSLKAYAWAEAVADFIADRRLLETFRPEDVEERFKALVPPEAMFVHRGGIVDGSGESFLGNPEKGVSRLYYELSDGPSGTAQISSVMIYMPRTDPDGVDVLSRVVAALRRKLRRPWIGIHRPGNPYFWQQREALLAVMVQIVDNMPDTHGGDSTRRSISGSWVWVHFGHVEGFDEEP